MAAWKEILRRATYLGRRSQFDRELDDEIQFHIDARAEELEEQGVPAEAARERARREFGPRARMQEDTRGAWQFTWIEDLWRDLGYAMRTFGKSPGFTAIAVLSLAMGVGANCGMFIFVDGFLLRPLPVPEPSGVVTVYETTLESGDSNTPYPDYAELRDRSKSFQSLTAFTSLNVGFAQPGALPRTKDGQLVTGNYFDVLGVKPELGRSFLPQEDQVPGRDPVVILSHDLWEREFGSDPAVLGKQVRLGGIAFTIVGVLPARFTTVDEDVVTDIPDFYVPMMMAPRLGNQDLLEARTVQTLGMLGRLRRGVSIQEARAELATIAASLEKQFPETNKNRTLGVQTVLRFRTNRGGTVGLMVMMLAGAVLLVACFNVAGLLTSRASGRAQEIAMRLALGAGRARLIRQLLTESLLLAAAGTATGLGIGYLPLLVVKRLIREILPNDPQTMPFKLDERVLLFSVATALLSVVLFGLVPAFRATRADLNSAMKGSGALPPRRRRFFRHLWGRNLLVVGQVAISILLLTVSSIIYVGLRGLLVVVRDTGFPSDRVLTMIFDPVVSHYKEAQARQFYRQLTERARSLAGVSSVTFASQSSPAKILPEGIQADPKAAAPALYSVWAEDNFFDALAIPILRGRGFLHSDSASAPGVAVINESLAKYYWPGQDAIGKRVRIGDKSDARWVQIVGVASIKNYEELFEVPPPKLIFFPAAQNPKQVPMALFAQSAADPTVLVASLRAVVRELDPAQAIPDVHPWNQMYQQIQKALRLVTQVIGAMGGMGMLLALVGLYGLVAYDVSTRTREIGIRMALGAASGRVLRMVLRQGLVLAVCGIGSGLLLNYGAGSLLLALFPNNIHQNAPTDDGFHVQYTNLSYTLLILVVLGLTMLAAYIPARRAARVDPNEALRCE